ncbi:hypothetical protein [Rickettsiella endosymbiont of Aleochara curtula]|uniref:hypothetical protein n=1 Tax=Rickettsiella endosymbiont of Aleochara curtula TaxID=3077936 RepID=UPI00313EDD21
MLPITNSMFQDYQTYIVNLSAIHKLKPISEVLNQFADLHYTYAQSWLGKWYSKMWVSLKYLSLNRSINDYKLGKVDTDTFISKLKEIFYFIPADKNPEKLLEAAWNSLIAWDIESTARLKSVLDKNKPIYFISNTNPLNIKKIIQLFQDNCPNDWQLPEETEAKPLAIAKNFYLCPSYLFKEFKEGTPGLISDLVDRFLKETKPENILLVSQYQPDLAKAEALGIESRPADEFFPKVPAPAAVQSSLNNTVCVTSPTTTAVFPLPNNILASSQQSFFGTIPKNEENPAATTSEKTPLLHK